MEVIGLIASCIAIGELAGKSLKHLFSLQRKLQDSGFRLQIISSQIVAVNAATTHIRSWLDTYTAGTCMASGVAEDLTLALDGCNSLLLIFSKQAASLDSGHDTLLWTDRVKIVWNETELNNYRDMLRDQVQVLSLLLQVMKLPTPSEQRSLLTVPDNQKIIQRVYDDSTSLIQLRDTDTDTDTLHSAITRDTDNDDGERLSMSFDFDAEVFQSRAYQTVLAPYIRTKLLEERAAAKARIENRAPAVFDNNIPALVQHYYNKNSSDVDQSLPSVSSIACHLGVEQTKLENLLLEAKNKGKSQLETPKSALQPLKPGMLANLMLPATTRVALLELNQLYRFPYRLPAISIDDFNNFQRVWKIYDPNGMAYISRAELPRFLSNLDGPFSVRVYDPEFSVHTLLLGVGTSPALESLVQFLENKLEDLPSNEIRMRKVALDILYNEIGLLADPNRGVSFWAALSSILNFKRITDPDWRSSSKKDILIALEQNSPAMLGKALRRHHRLLRVEEKKNIETIIGFFDTLYWSRTFTRHMRERKATSLHMSV